MDDLEKYIDFLYEGQQGYVYSPVKRSMSWDSHFFSWPTERNKLLDHIKVNGSESDVYLCPAVFSKKDAKRESFKSSRVVWVEFDGKEEISFRDIPKPNAIVQTSSSTHLHCYWRIEQTSSSEVVDDVNRRLTYYFQADSSGWDVTQLLRPPTTSNIKREKESRKLGKNERFPVLLAHFERTGAYRLSEFDNAPEVETHTVDLQEAQLLDPIKLLKSLPLLKSLKDKIEKEAVSEGERSQFLYKIAHELAETGCNHTQIASIVWYVDDRIEKFKYRNDRLVRISELASLAIHSVTAEEDISLYSLIDVLEHTEELEWIYDKWLHNQGLMIVTGAPGVGKTQFCLNMMNAFSVGDVFITSELTQQTALFMSLEMDVRELKFILQKQAVGYRNLHLASKNSRYVDEPGSLLQYEELFEQYRPGVVFIDSLFELSHGEIKDGPEVLQLTRWLKRMRRKYDMAMVIIHHNRKSSTTNKKPNKLDDLFGSVVLNKEIDTAICLWQEENEPHIDLFPVKCRYSQREDMKIVRTENLLFERVGETEADSESERPITSKAEAEGRLGF